jgi:hypothetical protein
VEDDMLVAVLVRLPVEAGAACTVMLMVLEVDALKLGAPPYSAVSACFPTDNEEVVIEAAPDERTADPIGAEPS